MKYLLLVYCDLFSCFETGLMHNLTSKAVARFLWEDIICGHGCFEKLVIDGKSINKDAV